MRRLYFVTAMFLFTLTTFAQATLTVSYPDFVSWAKQIKVSGYPFVESEQDGSDYSAMFGSGPEKALQLRVYDIARFSEYKSVAKQAAVYSWNGYQTVYYEFSGVTFLSLQLPEVQLAILFGINGKATKAAMEDIAGKSNLRNLKPNNSEAAGAMSSGVKWPDAIPADLRLSNVVSIESLGSDGTYKDVIQVKATMNPALITSVQNILKKYNGELTLTSTVNLDFICAEAESLAQLQQDFKPGVLVTFMYYIK
ncbi:MAG: hypothetical protein Q7U54_08405 [Bacteroidales bacterium]|nr:hypothetical protein [Bacteroidales bacterium]